MNNYQIIFSEAFLIENVIFSPFWDLCISRTTVTNESNIYRVTCNNFECHSMLNSLTFFRTLVKYEYNLLVFQLFTARDISQTTIGFVSCHWIDITLHSMKKAGFSYPDGSRDAQSSHDVCFSSVILKDDFFFSFNSLSEGVQEKFETGPGTAELFLFEPAFTISSPYKTSSPEKPVVRGYHYTP